MTPEEVLARVNSRETFLEFLKLLENDFSASVLEEAKNSSSLYGSNAHGWENITIDKFLGAARAWANDSDGSDSPSWQWLAMLLLAGKGYE
jgi:hypothetical protein